MKLKSIPFILAMLLISTLACGGVSSRESTADALRVALSQTAAVSSENGSDTSEGSNSALQTAEAEATAHSLSAQATQSADTLGDQEAFEATQTAAAPIQAELSTYSIDPNTGEIGWIHPPVEVSVEGYLEYDYINYYIGLPIGDFVISSDITWEVSTGLSGCGFVMRSDGNREAINQYIGLITPGGGGSVGFVMQKEGEFFYSRLEAIGGRDANFHTGAGTTNRLTIVAVGDKMSFYTNGVFVHEFTAGEYDRGFVAMGVTNESGQSSCQFDNSWLWILDQD